MRYTESIILEICKDNDIKFESFCDGYCYRLSKNNKFTLIYDNIFEENNSVTYKILKDKAAVYEILSKDKIPAVEHFYFNPQNNELDEFYTIANTLLKKYKKLVLKYNEGMSGNCVFLVDNEKDLKEKSNLILDRYSAITISPFYEIKHEYRVIFLNNEIKLIFDKIRPSVIGDEKSTISELVKKKYTNNIKPDETIKSNYIPNLNEAVLLSWRHNLNFGANPKELKDENVFKILQKIALDSAKTLKIKFASIDIIETADNKYKVLEINGSVTTGKFASFSKENYEKAKAIYQQVILENLK